MAIMYGQQLFACIVSALFVSVEAYVMFSPCGVNLCRLKCMETVACIRITFYPIRSMCCIPTLDGEICSQDTLHHVESVQVRNVVINRCPCGSRVVVSRRNRTVCGKDMGIQRPVDWTCVWKKRTRLFSDLVKTGIDSRIFKKYDPQSVNCREADLDSARSLPEDDDDDATWTGTPLLFAASGNRVELFDFLVEIGCNVTAVEENGNNALHLASMFGHVDTVKHILKTGGIEKEARGANGNSPLLWAVRYGGHEVFDLLLSSGCDPNAVTFGGKNILHQAVMGEDKDMVERVISLHVVAIDDTDDVEMTPLLLAADQGNTEVFDFLLKQGCDVKAVNEDNNGILHLASSNGHGDMVELIISKNLVDKDQRGHGLKTPLMLAAENDYEGVFDLLVGLGCDVTSVDDKGRTILHIAAELGHDHLVRHMLAIPDVRRLKQEKDKYGRTPLEVAEKQSLKLVLKP